MAKPSLLKLALEGIVVGIVIMFIGTVVTKLSSSSRRNNKSDPNMYFALFFTGLLGHFMFEFMGINRWYCKNYLK